MADSYYRYLERLRQEHLKVTPKRQAIIDLFDKAGKCLTPEDVWEKLRKEFGHFGLPSVYRNLELFAKYGILVKIERFDRKRYYALCKEQGKQHHHHIVCVECGRVEAFPFCHFPKVKRVNGYKVISHTMQIEGLCPDCR